MCHCNAVKDAAAQLLDASPFLLVMRCREEAVKLSRFPEFPGFNTMYWSQCGSFWVCLRSRTYTVGIDLRQKSATRLLMQCVLYVNMRTVCMHLHTVAYDLIQMFFQ